MVVSAYLEMLESISSVISYQRKEKRKRQNTSGNISDLTQLLWPSLFVPRFEECSLLFAKNFPNVIKLRTWSILSGFG